MRVRGVAFLDVVSSGGPGGNALTAGSQWPSAVSLATGFGAGGSYYGSVVHVFFRGTFLIWAGAQLQPVLGDSQTALRHRAPMEAADLWQRCRRLSRDSLCPFEIGAVGTLRGATDAPAGFAGASVKAPPCCFAAGTEAAVGVLSSTFAEADTARRPGGGP